VASFLGERPALLILDNLEQLGPAAAPVVGCLLNRSRSTTCLATSRRPLDLPGERLYTVPPLPTPEASASPDKLLGCASVRLFVDRAQAAKPDFQLTASNAETIAMVCERLEGIPLAIELAAARAQAMTMGRMLAQLQRPFEFLVSRRLLTEERHKALEATIDWSYQLLPSEVQRFFAGLSVFRGGCTPEAAEAVCEEPRALEYLEELTASSLVMADETDDGMRFHLLETLREFGRERLGEKELQRRKLRHTCWYYGLTLRLRPGAWLGGEALDHLEADHDNLRAALDWCASEDGDAALGSCLAGSVAGPWLVRGHWAEARASQLRAIECLDAEDPAAPSAEADLSWAAAHLSYHHGDGTLAKALFARALEIWQEWGHKYGVGEAHRGLGYLAWDEGEYSESRTHFERALALAREREEDDRRGIPVGRYAEVSVVLGRGGDEETRRHYDEAIALGCGQGGSPSEELASSRSEFLVRDLVALSIAGLGAVDLVHGHYESGEGRMEEALRLFREIDDRVNHANVTRDLGRLERARGNWARSQQLHHQVLQAAREFGQPWGVAWSLLELGRVAADEGDYRLARELLEEAFGVHGQLGARIWETSANNLLARVVLAEGDPALARRLHERVRTIASETRLRPNIATSLDGLGAVAACEGRPDEALQHRREALRLWHEMGTPREIAENLEAVAGLMATPGRAEVGATLLGVAEAVRKTIGAPVPPAQRRALRETRSTLRKLLKPSKYAAARKRGRPMTLDEAVQLALGAE
jgi:predicted ATPase